MTSIDVDQPTEPSSNTSSIPTISSAQHFFAIAELRDAVLDKLGVRQQLVLQRVNKGFQESVENSVSLRHGDTTTFSPVLDSLRGITIASKNGQHAHGLYHIDSIQLVCNFDKIEKNLRGSKLTGDVKTPTFTFSLAKQARIDGLTGGDELAWDVGQASFKDFYLTTREMKTCLQLAFVDCGGRIVYITIHTLAHLKIGRWFEVVNSIVSSHNNRMKRSGYYYHTRYCVPKRESWLDGDPLCTWGEIELDDGYVAWWRQWVFEQDQSMGQSAVDVFAAMDRTDGAFWGKLE
ncbi:hypothetical protein LTR56_010018 [Elasticomyces elasticus]|nr:hypothetical protein LTR56_010018 [Elasticomyces elasticus]KAK3665043.1 hypothetical protein LTR22_004098 [Elasticomyces elasticus]KAK4931580.1 hypothetical protein LTR49_001969 [Elasticomyces elasticus]KAK5766740.1 hypothetical protein LTS12_003090 [Elasticomyces elasticus]